MHPFKKNQTNKLKKKAKEKEKQKQDAYIIKKQIKTTVTSDFSHCHFSYVHPSYWVSKTNL
jgi:hypothetical protein